MDLANLRKKKESKFDWWDMVGTWRKSITIVLEKMKLEQLL